jgi:hypothetical protein
MTTLTDLLRSGASLDRISNHLDNLAPEVRTAEAMAVSRGDQKKLFDVADPVITLDHFAPEGSTLHPIVHEGMNNQPAFRKFQKPCTRATDGSVFGYNEGLLRPVIGPGYFVARETGKDPRGHVVVDYFMCPAGEVPAGWPEIVPNSVGLQRFVFHRCRDYIRRVSAHVSIGKAYKDEQTVMGYFILARQGV